jgi:lipoate-protein ligase A
LNGSSLANAPLRLLPFDRLTAERQLALSEAALDEVGRNGGPPTLRIYGWPGSTTLLGAGQTASAVDREACERLGIPLLRRMSGGTAVLHDEQTISLQLTLPAVHPLLSEDIHRNFRWFSELLIAALERLGIAASWMPLDRARAEQAPAGLEAACYSTLAPYEIAVNGHKLIGHGQMRRARATALQAMIYRVFDASKTVRLLAQTGRFQAELERDLAERVTDLRTAAGRDVATNEYVDAVVAAVESNFGPIDRAGTMTAAELDRAEELVRTKYGNPEWTFRR